MNVETEVFVNGPLTPPEPFPTIGSATVNPLLKPAEAVSADRSVKRYVCGFAFNSQLSEVALIRKKKPEWQVGRQNGVGGKIEAGEAPLDAMVREFEEETTVKTDFFQWRHYAQLTIRADVKVGKVQPASVDFFCAVLSREQGWEVKTNTYEEVVWMPLEHIRHDAANLLPNICWLVPMALRHLQGETVRFAHIIEN